jgi:predicted RNA-binding protein with TRAM domain
MSNRNFDNRVILQRLQEKNYARSLYSNNVYGQALINNPQTSNGNASKFNGFALGSQTMYFKGLLGGGETVDLGATTNIPPLPSTSQAPPAPIELGPGSIYFNYESGDSGSYISYPNENLSIGSESFTIEWYQYWEDGAQYPRVFSIGSYGAEHIDIAVSYEVGEGETFYFWKNSNSIPIGSGAPPKNEWVHMAIVGTDGNKITFYQNGNQIHEINEEYNFSDFETSLTIGNESDPSQQAAFTGKITNFRWIVGASLYTTPFFPPPVPLSITPDTKLLLLTSSSIALTKDNSTYNRDPIRNGVIHSPMLPTTITTVPSQPTITSIVAGNRQITVNFTVPVYNGNSEIIGYEYSIDDSSFRNFNPTNYSIIITTLTDGITPLVNGTTYNVKIRAVNIKGPGYSSNSESATPSTVPGQPSISSILPGDKNLTVNFVSGSNGGSTITNYEYSTDGQTFRAFNPVDTTSPVTIITQSSNSAPLVNGTSYSIRLRAVNSNGSGIASAAMSSTPVIVPNAPTIVTVYPDDKQLTVVFTPPTPKIGETITGYKYSITNGTFISSSTNTESGGYLSIIITGLTNGTPYNISLRAVNSFGQESASSTTQGTPSAPIAVPGVPTITYMVAANNGAYLYFTAGSGVVDNYEYTLTAENPPFGGSVQFTVVTPSDILSPIFIVLDNNTSSPVRIRAINSAGKSSWSDVYNISSTNSSIPDALLMFDPNNSTSYSGTGSSVKSIGTNNLLTGTKGSSVGYNNETLSNNGDVTSLSRKVFDFSGLNGNQNVITFPTFNFGTQISATAWVYPRSKNDINGLLVNTTANVIPSGFKFQWNGWQTNNRRISMQSGNGASGGDNSSVNNVIDYGVWQHIGYVFDQDNRRIIFFKNGVPVDMGSSIETVTNIGTNQAFNIGGYIGGSYTMNAKLGYIKVFNTLLNASEVLSDYNNTKAQFGF